MNSYIITAAALSLPVALLILKFMKDQKKKKTWHSLAQAYERLLWEGKLSVEQSEILGKKVIALDRRNKKLLVIDHGGAKPLEQCLSLRDVEATRIVEKRDPEQGCVQQIFLELRSEKSGEIIRVCFYDEDHDSLAELKRLTRKALQWKTRIDVHRSSGNFSREMEYVL